MPSYNNTVETFRSNFFGVRQNRFMVIPSYPQGIRGPSSDITQIIVKAADIPEASIGVINVPWMGRTIKFSGERTYSEWSIQIYESNQSVNDLRKVFEDWMDLMDQRTTHKISYDVAADWEVWYNDVVSGQKTTSTSFTRGVRLVKCFPINVGALNMDYDVADSFAIFPVTLAFDYWEPLGELGSGQGGR